MRYHYVLPKNARSNDSSAFLQEMTARRCPKSPHKHTTLPKCHQPLLKIQQKPSFSEKIIQPSSYGKFYKRWFLETFPSPKNIVQHSWRCRTGEMLAPKKIGGYKIGVMFFHEKSNHLRVYDVHFTHLENIAVAKVTSWFINSPFPTNVFSLNSMLQPAVTLETLEKLVNNMGFLEDHPRTDGYVVDNHGDPVRPLRIGLWDPFQMADI